MTLLRDIQQAALDPSVDIMTLLRKARVLAARLKSREFEEWVRRELDGYGQDDELPSYRKLSVQSKAFLRIGYYQQLPSAPVMATLIPEGHRHWATTAHLRESVCHYASLVASAEHGKRDHLVSEWPQEIAVKYGGSGYNEAECLRAWREIGKGSLVALIETVRNRILEFTLQIEAAAPDAGEAHPDSTPIPQDRVSQIFHTYVVAGTRS